MEIRKYQEKDKEEVKSLIRKILFNIFKKEPCKLEDLDAINKNYALFLVVEDMGKIVGAIGLIRENEIGILKRMYIQEEYRNKGVGKQLYGKVEEYCRENGIKRIKLSTTPEMKVAIKFYIGNGFTKTGIDKNTNQIFFEKEIK